MDIVSQEEVLNLHDVIDECAWGSVFSEHSKNPRSLVPIGFLALIHPVESSTPGL